MERIHTRQTREENKREYIEDKYLPKKKETQNNHRTLYKNKCLFHLEENVQRQPHQSHSKYIVFVLFQTKRT
jgi:hypothetical protein